MSSMTSVTSMASTISMAPTHPLQIPEILFMVAKYIPRRHLPTCARVSKAWYGAVIPVLWENIHGDNPPFNIIQQNAHFVRSFTLGACTRWHLSLQFPNLVSLIFTPFHYNRSAFHNWIIAHKFITHLEFEATPPRLPWKALLGFHNLKSLKIIHLTLSQENIDRFWQLCSQLEQLDIRDLKDRGSLSSWTFPHLKELRLWTCPSADIPLTLEFMRRCPALTSFDWCGKNVGSFTTEFIQLLDARTWPLLHSFNSRNHTITSNDVLKIAQGMQQIVSFGFIVDRLQPKPFLEVLRPHFSRLKKLTMDTVARMPDGFIPEILSSCPMLEIMEAPVVDAKEIVEGEPWVCLNLRELRLGFRFTPATLSLLQPLVFDQLCKLTRLESLALGTRYIISLFQERVDLRLEQGLGKLSKLVSLRVLNFSGSKQAMNKRDVDWILEHWTELTDVFGIPRYNDPVIASELGGRIRERGVTWHAIY